LVKLAGLRAERDADASANPALLRSWQVVKDWSEITHKKRRTKLEAEKLYQAVTHTAEQFRARVPTHIRGRSFGGTSVEGVYVYSPPVAAVTK
jgi:hypothetical protein